MGYRYRLHYPKLPGKPDLVFPARRKIIDVRGCFWHQHRGCTDAHIPGSNVVYWRAKLEGNKQRDRRNRTKWRRQGWSALTVWECEISDPREVSKRIRRFLG